jgi:hypothetical protein
MDHLKKNSLFAENLTNEFKHQYEDYSILSFYETRGFKNTANVVCLDMKEIETILTGPRLLIKNRLYLVSQGHVRPQSPSMQIIRRFANSANSMEYTSKLRRISPALQNQPFSIP